MYSWKVIQLVFSLSATCDLKQLIDDNFKPENLTFESEEGRCMDGDLASSITVNVGDCN